MENFLKSACMNAILYAQLPLGCSIKMSIVGRIESNKYMNIASTASQISLQKQNT